MPSVYWKQLFPFVRHEEQKRIGKNMIEKRHFKFTYDSPINGKEFYIILDVLFEHNLYARLEQRDIQNELLLTEPEMLKVWVPSAECIRGDKLTAFAPHTTGIPLNIGKDMEVMKQFYDVCSLLEVFTDFDEVKDTYEKVVKSEIAYCGTEILPKDVLQDMFEAAFCIASHGKFGAEEFPLYVKDIRELRSHIYAENYSPEIAAGRAAKVIYMVTCLLTNTAYERVGDYRKYVGLKFTQEDMLQLKYLKKANPEAYAYAIKADQLLALLRG